MWKLSEFEEEEDGSGVWYDEWSEGSSGGFADGSGGIRSSGFEGLAGGSGAGLADRNPISSRNLWDIL